MQGRIDDFEDLSGLTTPSKEKVVSYWYVKIISNILLGVILQKWSSQRQRDAVFSETKEMTTWALVRAPPPQLQVSS